MYQITENTAIVEVVLTTLDNKTLWVAKDDLEVDIYVPE